MYVFIAIIFIAELIIAGFLLERILKADNAVKALDKKIALITPDIVTGLRAVRKGGEIVRKSIENAVAFIQRKRYEFRLRVINLILINLLLLILKTKFKKTAALCQYAVLLKDYWDSIPG